MLILNDATKTVADALRHAAGKLQDYDASVYTGEHLMPFFQEAWEKLSMRLNQASVLHVQVTVEVSLTGLDADVASFGPTDSGAELIVTGLDSVLSIDNPIHWRYTTEIAGSRYKELVQDVDYRLEGSKVILNNVSSYDRILMVTAYRMLPTILTLGTRIGVIGGYTYIANEVAHLADPDEGKRSDKHARLASAAMEEIVSAALKSEGVVKPSQYQNDEVDEYGRGYYYNGRFNW